MGGCTLMAWRGGATRTSSRLTLSTFKEEEHQKGTSLQRGACDVIKKKTKDEDGLEQPPPASLPHVSPTGLKEETDG